MGTALHRNDEISRKLVVESFKNGDLSYQIFSSFRGNMQDLFARVK